ncbi:MAG: hypothetical protein H6732_00700 [Alphaproteobacteria bacterium]|nr:hypothetical protein [Alphaproteobacteria bacterium]
MSTPDARDGGSGPQAPPPDSLSAEEKARRRAEVEARIRSMQFDQYTEEGKPAKERVGLGSAYVVSTLAALLPTRVRTLFAFALNFVYNRITATFRLLGAWFGHVATSVAIFLVYWLVVGPTSLLVRAFGADYLRATPVKDSNLTTKEPPDTTEDRFLRQF